ncbi:ankyrin [Hyaloscypha bicolor E]|uniref:Ankyrin n=1 Tax=Hyaloscypha bicolor E TaxID=1095630 RepID=A0A2J6TNL8_9HELO|nr:ankyrin [Hyaloscypha bicolor E]PMD64614.1 ankyrin [Hyaloscypha bicolor E]
MLFQDLPAELLQKILVQAILARGVKRGLRLRLVCKLFSHKIQPALFESRLLDDFYVEAVAPNWYIQNNHGASAFFHSYLVYRVQNETSPHQRRFLNIYQVSERVCEESSANANLVTTIETLCWPALHEAMKPSTNTKIEKDPLSPGLDLLCAAAYLNLIPLAKRLLQEGHRPTCESHLFSSPMRLAAWAGNADMMKLFQENLPEYDEKGLRDSLMGVAIRGDIKLARLATYPPSRATPDSTDIAGQQFGNMDRQESAGNALSCAQWSTRDIEVYQYFESFFAKPDELNFNLTKHARLGNLEMTRYLLDEGADIRGTMGRWGNPLCCACRGCHEDIVGLLLERGANPNYGGDEERVQGRNPIVTAAKAGSLAIVRKLIDHGVDLSLPRQGYSALRAAVLLEHTAMVKLLLERGVGLEKKERLLELARSKGLDSMIEVLQEEGT